MFHVGFYQDSSFSGWISDYLKLNITDLNRYLHLEKMYCKLHRSFKLIIKNKTVTKDPVNIRAWLI
jgi:hypothetical protein